MLKFSDPENLRHPSAATSAVRSFSWLGIRYSDSPSAVQTGQGQEHGLQEPEKKVELTTQIWEKNWNTVSYKVEPFMWKLFFYFASAFFPLRST